MNSGRATVADDCAVMERGGPSGPPFIVDKHSARVQVNSGTLRKPTKLILAKKPDPLVGSVAKVRLHPGPRRATIHAATPLRPDRLLRLEQSERPATVSNDAVVIFVLLAMIGSLMAMQAGIIRARRSVYAARPRNRRGT
jgi:hypothetical protein